MLEIDNLCVERGNKTLVTNVSLTAQPGSLTAIIGPNGAGKTSVFKAVSGEWPVQMGNISIGGKNRTSWPQKLLAQHLAVMGQSPTLNFDLTVQELVQLGRAPHRRQYSEAVENSIISVAIDQADLTGFRHRNVLSLSGGERQRAFFAKTLAQLMPTASSLASESSLMLLDEPTSALDLGQQAQLMQSLRNIVASGGCVVTILHDLNLAAAFADQIVMMKEGKVFSHGTPTEVLTTGIASDCYGCEISVYDNGKKPLISLSAEQH